jgi:hypothetical protein
VIRLGQKRCGACSPLWLHEIKHDGFRMLVRRDAAGVRLFTRNGHDWTARFPLIARAALSLKAASCLIDGEAVACDDNGLPVFDRLRYRRLSLHSVHPARTWSSRPCFDPRDAGLWHPHLLGLDDLLAYLHALAARRHLHHRHAVELLRRQAPSMVIRMRPNKRKDSMKPLIAILAALVILRRAWRRLASTRPGR